MQREYNVSGRVGEAVDMPREVMMITVSNRPVIDACDTAG